MPITEEKFEVFLEVYLALEKSTIRTYLNRFRIIRAWLKKNNLELNKDSVAQFLSYKRRDEGLSNSSVNTYRHTLVHLDAYYEHYELPYGFTKGTKSLPKKHPEINILSQDEIRKLLKTNLTYKNRNGKDNNNLDLKYLTFTTFLALTGCRFGEAITLKIKRLDIDNGRATLVNTKNKRNRFIYFTGPIKERLKELIHGRDSEGLVFTNSKGNHLYPGDFNNNLRLRAEKAGITKKIHAQLLRHSYATHLLESVGDITKVASILGHKDIQTTFENYTHLADNTLRKASQRHPLLRPYIGEKEVIEELREVLEGFNFSSDSRFEYKLIEENGSLELKLSFNP